jgi:S-sulfo-L-cysteine synthase (O-acetyl-L-serine-dependent)
MTRSILRGRVHEPLFERRRARGATALLNQIGGTPLLELRRIGSELRGAEIYAKLEWRNPGGSVKDRPALAMVEQAEQSGALTPRHTILDATSGNTGIAYGMIGAVKGYQVTLCLPANASLERVRIMRACGVELRLTSPQEGSDGAILEARRIASRDGDRYLYLDQYSNPANWQAHYRTTGVEILDQTGGRITHFVAGLGTSGTLQGVGRRLREEVPGVRIVALEPDAPFHGLEGLKHMESAIVPAIFDPAFPDERRGVPTEAAYGMVRRAAREEGLLIGISSGAALHGALEVAREALRRGETPRVVTVFPDGGDRYLGDRFWQEEL